MQHHKNGQMKLSRVNNELHAGTQTALEGAPNPLNEQTMSTLRNTGKTILNALAFANVSTLRELRARLRQIDAPTEPPCTAAPREDMPRTSGTPGAPALHPMRGAL